MLIDTGVGIGDLHGFVRTLTDKPLMVCYTHNHMDHVGGAGAFDNAHIHPKDMAGFPTGGGIGLSVEGRRWYVTFIAEREMDDYPYDLDVDLTEWGPEPPLFPLEDGQVIDLGNRRITVVACPGHTAGSVTLLDEATRTLFHGDACNCNLGLRATTVETALFYLKRLRDMGDRYDRYYNGHYDFRRLGEPLGEDVLPDAIAACEQIVAGMADVKVEPSPLMAGRMQHVVTVGRTNISFNPERVHDSA